MEVLLLQDINGVGQKDDLLVVGDGYALNFLLPQSKALIATPTVRRRYADRIRRRALEREELRIAEQSTASAIAQKSITLSRKASEAKKLYAAVTAKSISEALKEQHSIEIAESAIHLAEPIKALGEFTVDVEMSGAKAALSITIIEEK